MHQSQDSALEHSAEETRIGHDQPVIVDFDFASEVTIQRLVAIAPVGLKTRIALPVGRDGEPGQLDVDG